MIDDNITFKSREKYDSPYDHEKHEKNEKNISYFLRWSDSTFISLFHSILNQLQSCLSVMIMDSNKFNQTK